MVSLVLVFCCATRIAPPTKSVHCMRWTSEPRCPVYKRSVKLRRSREPFGHRFSKALLLIPGVDFFGTIALDPGGWVSICPAQSDRVANQPISERDFRDQPRFSLSSAAVIQRGGHGGSRLARRVRFRVGHVRRSTRKHGEVLLSHVGGCCFLQAAVRTCAARASCLRPQLTGDGRARLRCRRARRRAAATRRFTSSARTSLCARAVIRRPTTGNGSMSTASPTRRMPRNS
jgi:hypothetical protein